MQNKNSSLSSIKWLFLSAFIALISLAYFHFFACKKPGLTSLKKLEIKQLEKNAPTSLSFEDFPLELNLEYPLLKDSLELYQHIPRPSQKKKKPYWEVQFSYDPAQVRLTLKERIYLVFREGKFHFSDTPTSFYITCEKIDKNSAVFKMKMILPEQVKVKGTDFFNVEYKPNFRKACLNEKALTALEKVKLWQPDLYLQVINASNKTCYQIQSDGQFIPFLLNDLLIYKDGTWQKALNLSTSIYPVGQVKKIYKDKILFSIWNERDHYQEIEIPFQKEEKVELPQDLKIQNIFLRSKHHIRANLGKWIIYLKENDAIIKDEEGCWKKIPQAQKNLSLLPKKPFLYFFKIETQGNKKFFKAYYFSPFRTAYQEIKIPIEAKTSLHSKRSSLKLNRFSAKRR
jgi:hypothetical protein